MNWNCETAVVVWELLLVAFLETRTENKNAYTVIKPAKHTSFLFIVGICSKLPTMYVDLLRKYRWTVM